MSTLTVGFAVGDTIQALKKYQTHTNAGMFGALQDAAIYALNHYDDFLEEQSNVFKTRRDRFEAMLGSSFYHLFMLKVAYMYGWKHRLVMTASNLSNF